MFKTFKCFNFYKLFLCALLVVVTTITSFSRVYAAKVIPIYSDEREDEEYELIDDSTIQMIVTETIFAYKEPNIDSLKIFHLSGGVVVSADINSLGSEFITAKYHDTICYIECNKAKAVVGNTQNIKDQVDQIYQKYKYDAEDALEIIPAPHHYSVAGHTLYYNYQDYIWTLCVKYEIEDYFEYLLCQFFHESRYQQNAVSHTNDYGICQLNGKYHDSFTARIGHPDWDVKTDPYANMYCGVHIMANNIKNRKGDIDIAMTDYNAGGGYYAKHGVREVYTNRVHYWYSTLKALD